ncbi:unnamed protein product [Ophioblennius macclurei]
MALLSRKLEHIGDAKLEKWDFIASGGFGRVYKARHKDLGCGVAVKLMHHVTGSPSDHLSDPSLLQPNDEALYEEARQMNSASCQFVLMVYGFYQGIPPVGGGLMQQGLVMELMERGSVQTLQTKLCGPPPTSLAFRLAYEVAAGMNFLHLKNIMHHDLKPSNVLLTDALNAKLADFGLSRISTSALSANEKTAEMTGGSYKYMPPEAFSTSYKPVRAFDRYSYGILLWSIFSGKEPYPGKDYNLVAFRIPLGDRPCCDQINNVEKLGEMIELMKTCWDRNQNVRPTFQECLETTEKLFLNHKRGISEVVYDVQKKLDSSASVECVDTTDSRDTVDHPPVTPQNSDSVPSKTLTVEEKAKFVKDNFVALVQEVSAVMAIAEELGDMVQSEVRSGMEAKETSQDKMRLLYSRILEPAAGKVKAAFYDALKKHHPKLVEKLGG